eukprot:scaffold260_cov115-Cylindrotheca_fusiformis.AAC.7
MSQSVGVVWYVVIAVCRHQSNQNHKRATGAVLCRDGELLSLSGQCVCTLPYDKNVGRYKVVFPSEAFETYGGIRTRTVRRNSFDTTNSQNNWDQFKRRVASSL